MPKKPKDDNQRSPAEASALARKVMARMLASPPVPHEEISGNGKRRSKEKPKAPNKAR
jgi:hypothetical protein